MNSTELIFGLLAPAVFEPVLSAIRPFMSPLTNQALKIFGQSRREWEAILYKDIDRDQLPDEVRGTKIYDED